MDFSTDWLTDLLTYLPMPSDKYNSRMTRARDLISSLPFFLHNCTRWRFAVRHVMASVQDIKIAEAILILCLAYYVMKWVRYCWNWGVVAFMYWGMGRTFHKCILCVFRNCWMDCRDAFYAVLSLLCNGQNISGYEVYWLMGVPIINPWGACQPFFLLHAAVCTN